jgi:hypothetical protein
LRGANVADRVVYTTEAARAGLSVIALSIANPDATPTPTLGKVRLFDETLTLDQDTTREALVAAETTLTGYPVGGYDLEGFDSPKLAPLGGAVITSNLVDVAYASGDAVQIGGYWVEDHATPTPNVRYAVQYDPPRPLTVVGNGWPIVVQMGYGGNVTPSV